MLNSQQSKETTMNIYKLLEDTTLSYADGIMPADANLSFDTLFSDTYIPSLARQIFPTIPTTMPTGSLFAVVADEATGELFLKRNPVNVYPSTPIKTSITREAAYDIRNLFGVESNKLLVGMLRGFMNDQENVKCLEFLEAESKVYTPLTLSDPTNAEVILFELSKVVQQIVLEINLKRTKTFDAYAVVPYKHASAIMALSEYAGGDNVENRGLYIGKIGLTKYYVNPDAASTTCYVGLVDKEDIGRSSATFSPYVNQVYFAPDSDLNAEFIYLVNRYAITKSPAHMVGNEMMYKFTIS